MRACMFGPRLKLLREARGYTQEELAAKVGVATQQIWRWESGKNDPTGDMIVLLSQHLGTSSDYLLGRVDDPTANLTTKDLSPMERELIAAVRNGSIVEALKVITGISELEDQANIAREEKAANS